LAPCPKGRELLRYWCNDLILGISGTVVPRGVAWRPSSSITGIEALPVGRTGYPQETFRNSSGLAPRLAAAWGPSEKEGLMRKRLDRSLLEQFGVAPPPPASPIRWRAAVRALRALIAEPTRTEQVFELFNAVGGRDGERAFQEFLAHPDGARLLALRRELVDMLADTAALAALPEGSLGRAYLDHIERNRLDPAGVVKAARQVVAAKGTPVDAHRQWFFERLDVMHDLWHVLTGYGTDEAGEAALLAFTQGQMPQRGLLFLIAAAVWMGPKGNAFAWQRYLWRAWRRGRRAAALSAVVWEDLLPRPLAVVQCALAIEPAGVAHPGGIRRGTLVGDARSGLAAPANAR
jgi:ubiquinone biosynthesis protein COQ4